MKKYEISKGLTVAFRASRSFMLFGLGKVKRSSDGLFIHATENELSKHEDQCFVCSVFMMLICGFFLPLAVAQLLLQLFT
jgi:hypothetical protein